ncbi:MAG: DMT family transporter [Gammaproteobacteria bacterium]
MRSSGAKGVLAMFIAVAAFSFMDALLKLFSAHYPPVQVIFLRAVASLPFLLLPLWWRGGLAELRPTRPWLHLLRALLGILMLGTFIVALRDAPLASVYSVYMFAPLLIAALAAWFLRERVEAGCWIAIVVGFLGVLVILQPRPGGLPAAAGLAALVSALCYAIAVLVARVLTRTEHTAAVVFSFLALISLIAGAFALPRWVSVDPAHWAFVVAAGGFGAAGQHYITLAFKHAPAAVVAPVEYSALLWGLALDRVFWGVAPNPTVLAGAALVIAAGAYVAWRERHPEVPTT